MLDNLKEQVCKANLLLPKYKLTTFTWGNVSSIDRRSGLIVIKPSGVPYEKMTASDMVVVNLNGDIIEGDLNPSSDTPTHLELYKAFKNIGSVVHTHSRWATTFAQAGISIPAMGTTHADYFYGDIPCTRVLREEEIRESYEKHTGSVIVETFHDMDPSLIPGVLVNNHAPFIWGSDPLNAVQNAAIIEEIAFMAWHTIVINPNTEKISQAILDKHYLRKHGSSSYYGQKHV